MPRLGTIRVLFVAWRRIQSATAALIACPPKVRRWRLKTLRSEGVQRTTARSVWWRRPASKCARRSVTERRRTTSAEGRAATPASESKRRSGATERRTEAARVLPIHVTRSPVEVIAGLTTLMTIVAVVRRLHVCRTRTREMAIVRRPLSENLGQEELLSSRTSPVHK